MVVEEASGVASWVKRTASRSSQNRAEIRRLPACVNSSLLFLWVFLSTVGLYLKNKIDLCYIETGDMWGNVRETRNTVVFIGSLLMN